MQSTDSTFRAVQTQTQCSAVQVLLRSRDADLRHSISEPQGLHCRGAGVSPVICAIACASGGC